MQTPENMQAVTALRDYAAAQSEPAPVEAVTAVDRFQIVGVKHGRTSITLVGRLPDGGCVIRRTTIKVNKNRGRLHGKQGKAVEWTVPGTPEEYMELHGINPPGAKVA